MIWLLILLIAVPVSAKVAGPIYTHAEREQKEFEHLYKGVNKGPSIFIGTGAPSFTPTKEGDVYISTTTSKIYISTATVTSSSWAIVN